MTLRAVSPVPPTLALAFGGSGALRRKVLLHQSRRAECIALVDGDEPVVLIMFERQRARRAELALAFGPHAGAHARAMIRFAQLTLTAMADTGVLVFTRMRPGAIQGRRLAMLTGFVPGGFKDPAIWLWKERS